MLTKYGTDNIIIFFLISIILLFISFNVNNKYIHFTLAVISLLLIVFTFVFFRDPNRIIPEEVKNDNSFILSPADGVISEIILEEENEYIKNKVMRISIFLSPLNVHVNRIPVSGKLEYVFYKKGQFLPAYVPKSSELNEQSRFGVTNEFGKVFFKQITGMLARRIVYDIKEGDEVKIGERFGMMKFSSRMDIAFETDTEIFVKKGDKVVGGETILAKLKK